MTELYRANYVLYEVIDGNTDDIGQYDTRDEAAKARRAYLERNPSLKNRDAVKIRVEYEYITTISN